MANQRKHHEVTPEIKYKIIKTCQKHKKGGKCQESYWNCRIMEYGEKFYGERTASSLATIAKNLLKQEHGLTEAALEDQGRYLRNADKENITTHITRLLIHKSHNEENKERIILNENRNENVNSNKKEIKNPVGHRQKEGRINSNTHQSYKGKKLNHIKSVSKVKYIINAENIQDIFLLQITENNKINIEDQQKFLNTICEIYEELDTSKKHWQLSLIPSGNISPQKSNSDLIRLLFFGNIFSRLAKRFRISFREVAKQFRDNKMDLSATFDLLKEKVKEEEDILDAVIHV